MILVFRNRFFDQYWPHEAAVNTGESECFTNSIFFSSLSVVLAPTHCLSAPHITTLPFCYEEVAQLLKCATPVNPPRLTKTCNCFKALYDTCRDRIVLWLCSQSWILSHFEAGKFNVIWQWSMFDFNTCCCLSPLTTSKEHFKISNSLKMI